MRLGKRVSIAALATVSLAINIPAVPTWPSGRCTDKSLTIPSWYVSNYTVVGGTTKFTVQNRANPSWALFTLECKADGACQGNAASDQFRARIARGTDGKPVVHMTEVWVCNDEGDWILFTASGSVTITECAGTNCVSPIPYLVYGTLELPVPITPAQASPPAGYLAPTCAEVGSNQWTVTDVSYKIYTKGQCLQWYRVDVICLRPNPFISKGTYLSFNVTNNAISHKVSCNFTPEYPDFTLPNPLRCTGGEFNEITLDVKWSGTAPNFNLAIEELWYCLENPDQNAEPSVIVASGSTSVPLTCKTSTGITGTADDIITICSDAAAAHSVHGNLISKKTLPEFSLVTAYPVHGGCTFDSVVNPTWFLRGMFFETKPFPPGNPSSATLERFTTGLTGPGFADYFFYGDEPLSGTGINTVYNCNHNPYNPDNCTFAFNPFTKVLTLEKVWQCSDKNPAEPLNYKGSGVFDWKAYPIYTCDESSTFISCYWHGDLANLQPGIPYDIPVVTVSKPQSRVEATFRMDGEWAKVN